MATVRIAGQADKVLAGALPGLAMKLGMQAYDGIPLFRRLIECGRKEAWEGESSQGAVLTETYDKASSYQNDDAVRSTDDVEPITAVQFELGGYQTTVNIPKMKIRKVQSSPKKVYDLAKIFAKIAIWDMKNLMSRDMFAAANDADGILSLSTITDATTTIAGLGGSAAWGGTTTQSGSFASQGKADLMTLWSTLSQYGELDAQGGGEEPDLHVTRKTERDYYWVSLESGMRYTPGGKGDVKLNLTFWEKPIIADEHCASGVWYMLNTNQMILKIMPGADFSISNEILDATQPDMYNRGIVWNGQIHIVSRRYHGKLYDLAG